MVECRCDQEQASRNENDRQLASPCSCVWYCIVKPASSMHSCMVAQRLSRQDWLEAALKSLAVGGYQSLRADRLAGELGVSRGSFYWHFSDVPDFEEAVLRKWETVAVDLPYAQAVAVRGQPASAALPSLIRSAFHSPVHLERAVRSWAAVSSTAAAAVQRVDQRRVALLTRLLRSSGTSAEHAAASAVILYWAYLGYVSTGSTMMTDGIVPAMIERFCPR